MTKKIKFIGISVALLITFSITEYFIPVHRYFLSDTETVLIKDKQIRTYNDGSSKYLIFTDKEVFEDVDEGIFFKWNSSDVYGQLEIGKEYNLKVTGVRFHYLSWYRNIISVKPKE